MQFNIPAEHKNASGVYIIRNTVNEKVYVGSSMCFAKRYKGHYQALRTDKHHSRPLQHFANKYGVETLIFELLELSKPEFNLVCEQKWMNCLEACIRAKGFNIAPLAGSCLGIIRSPETRRKASEARKGSVISSEQRYKISESLKGREFSQETRDKISQAKKGVPMPLEHRIKMKEIALNRLPQSKESHAKQADALRGRKQTQAHVEKRAQTHRGKKRSEETCRKIAEAVKGRVASDETRQKLSEIHKGKTISKEHRLKLAEAAKRRWANKKAGSQTSIAVEQSGPQLLLF
jgi:group I intron endonuclease